MVVLLVRVSLRYSLTFSMSPIAAVDRKERVRRVRPLHRAQEVLLRWARNSSLCLLQHFARHYFSSIVLLFGEWALKTCSACLSSCSVSIGNYPYGELKWHCSMHVAGGYFGCVEFPVPMPVGEKGAFDTDLGTRSMHDWQVMWSSEHSWRSGSKHWWKQQQLGYCTQGVWFARCMASAPVHAVCCCHAASYRRRHSARAFVDSECRLCLALLFQYSNH